MLALEHGAIPPSLHFRRPNPRLELESSPFYVPTAAIPWPAAMHPRRAGVSSFGIGGTNAHVVIEAAPAPLPRRRPAATGRPEETAAAAPAPFALWLSAADPEALDRRTADLARHLSDRLAAEPALDPEDVAFTLQAGRKPLAWRRALVARDLAEAAASLAGAGAAAAAGEAPLAFVFPGQGSQHPGMGAGLYARHAVFRDWIDRARELLAACEGGAEIAAALPPAGGAEDALASTAVAQPALFAVEHALAMLWRSWGAEPEALAGHSVGELTAACLAGVFDFETALALTAERGRLMAAMPPGAMTAVPLAEDELVARLAEVSPALAVAAINGPAAAVAAGPPEAIAELERRLAADGIAARRLHAAHAFHSPAAAAAVAPFRERVAAAAPAAPAIPLVSGLTGRWLTAEEAADPGHWAEQILRPVRFGAVLDVLLAEPRRLLLEVGPGTALTALARRHPAAGGRALIHSLPHPRSGEDDEDALLAAASGLWLAGARLERAGDGGRRVPLPVYPFAGERHWIDPPANAGTAAAPAAAEAATAGGAAAAGAARAAAGAAAAPSAAGIVARRPDPADWLYLPGWRRTAPAGPPAREAGEVKPEHGPVLLLATGGAAAAGLAAGLAEALRRRGIGATTALAGERFADRGDGQFTIRPAEPDDLRELFDALAAAGTPVRRAVWLGAAAGPEEAGDPVAEAAAAGAALLDAARALAAAGVAAGAETVHLVAVSDALFDPAGGPPRRPGRAAAAGLARVLPQETPGLGCRWVDVAAAESLGPADLDQLAAEVASTAAEPLVALRRGRRWRQVHEPLPVAGGAPAAAPAERWLITGAAGRFGSALAEHLLAGRRARVLLLDLRPPPPEVAARLAAAAAGGGEAVWIEGDVADPAVAAQAFGRAGAAWGGLDAVVHAAGAAAGDFAPLAEAGGRDLAARLRPKLGGLAALSAAAAIAVGDRPRLAVATSSLAPLLGGVGLGLHAAADAALGAAAEAAAQAVAPGALPWSSVDWEVWDQPFAAGGAAPGALGAEQAALALSTPEVLDSFERVAAAVRAAAAAGSPLPRLAVSAGDLEARVAEWAGTLRPRRPKAAAGRDAGTPYRAPRDAVESLIAGVWQEVLGVERIGLDDDFFLLGGDSLAGLQVLSKLRAGLAVELPLESFFAARTVAGMAETVAAERRRAADEEARTAELLAEIEALADGDVHELLEAERSAG